MLGDGAKPEDRLQQRQQRQHPQHEPARERRQAADRETDDRRADVKGRDQPAIAARRLPFDAANLEKGLTLISIKELRE